MLSKRFFTTAVVMAALVALVVPVAHASNMGFKLQRQLDLPAGSLGIYYMSFPFYRSFQDLGSFAAPQTGDSCITAADVLLDWFTNGDGFCPGEAGDNGNNFPGECEGEITLAVVYADPAVSPDQRPLNLAIKPIPVVGGIQFTGTDFAIGDPTTDAGGSCDTLVFAPNRTDEVMRGYTTQVNSGSFPAVIVGSHNPTMDEWVVPFYSTGSLNAHQFSLPYHFANYTNAEEFLTAVADPDGDGNIDQEITVSTFDPDPNNNPAQVPTNKQIKPIPVVGGIQFTPAAGVDNFSLTPGNGYILVINAGGAAAAITVPLPHY